MANKGKQAKEYLDSGLGKAKSLLREKELSSQAKDKLMNVLDEKDKNLSGDEISLIQKNRRTDAVKKAKDSWNASKSTEEYKNAQSEYQKQVKLTKEVSEKLGLSFQDAWKKLFDEEWKSNAQKSESKEKEKKLPQFEDKNHREISDDTWKIVPDKARIRNGSEYEVKDVKVRINLEKDIKEFVSGVPEHLVGEQVFSKRAMKRLASKLSGKMPADKRAIAEMIAAYPGENEKEKYDNFYEKNNIKNRLAGYWDPYNEEFDHVDGGMHCWSADGNYANFTKSGWDGGSTYDDYFFSVCLLKN